MRDFTLIIPTFNRPQMLSSALAYLQAECAECRILVADSSREGTRKANRTVAARQKLDLDYVEFPVETHPFDKFREAVHMAKTRFARSVPTTTWWSSTGCGVASTPCDKIPKLS
jgi:hypothetical protein